MPKRDRVMLVQADIYIYLIFHYLSFFILIYAIKHVHHAQMRQQAGAMTANNQNEVTAPLYRFSLTS